MYLFVFSFSFSFCSLMNTISAFDGRLRYSLYTLYRRLFGYKQPSCWGLYRSVTQGRNIYQSNKVWKRSLAKHDWKTRPKSWGTIPGQMVVRLKRIKNAAGGGDWTTVGATRRSASTMIVTEEAENVHQSKKRSRTEAESNDLEELEDFNIDNLDEVAGGILNGNDDGNDEIMEDLDMLDNEDGDEDDEWE
jgi:hypothetical protein